MVSDHIRQWQSRLRETFTYEGVIGGKLLINVIEQERSHGINFIQKYGGHRIVTDSFFEFFAESLTTSLKKVEEAGWPASKPYYPTCILYFLTMFRTARAADKLSVSGYPLDGYGILRTLKDQALALAAIANGFVTLEEVLGVASIPHDRPWTEVDHDEMYRRRIATEKALHRQMIGPKSGLSGKSQVEIEQWDRLFHSQVHGARWTFMREMRHLFGEEDVQFSLGPRDDEGGDAMFINRSNELDWMIVRLLPFLQLHPGSFGDEWATRWHVMDESFRVTTESLGDLGKKIAGAFTEMIDTKFKFDPMTSYVER